MAVQGNSILPCLLQWLMIYSFGINTAFGNKSQFNPLNPLTPFRKSTILDRTSGPRLLSNIFEMNFKQNYLQRFGFLFIHSR